MIIQVSRSIYRFSRGLLETFGVQSHFVHGYWLNASHVNNLSDGLIAPVFCPIEL